MTADQSENGETPSDDAAASSDDRGPGREHAPDEEWQEASPHEDRSLLFRGLIWLNENLLTLLGIGLIGGFIGASILGIAIPREVRLYGLVFGLTLFAIGRPTASKAQEWLWNPELIWIVDIDARIMDGAIYNEPAQIFREWDIEDSGDWVAPNLVFLRNVRFEEKKAEGCWRGTLTDRELLRALHAVHECRGRLERDAKEGFAIKSQAFVIVRRAAYQAVEKIENTFRRGTLPTGGEDREYQSVGEVIDETIEEFGLERLEKQADDGEGPADDVTGLGVRIEDVDELATAGRQAAPDGGSHE